MRPSSLEGRVCMITGANSGIGRSVAEQIASAGATVVMVCRDKEKGEAARNEIVEASGNHSVEVLLADLASLNSVRGLASGFMKAHDRLHLLFNNAAVVEGKRVVTEDGLDEMFQVNYLSHFLLTILLLDVLKRSAPSRIVNVVSRIHTHIDFDDLQEEKHYNPIRSYGQSKLAEIVFTYELAKRLQGVGVTVNCVHPGAVRSHLGDEGGLVGLGIKMIRPFVMSPDKAAKALVYVATSPELEHVSGKYFFKDKLGESSKESHDQEEARRLWEVSMRLCGLSELSGGQTGL